MPENNFFHVSRNEGQPTDIYINLTNVAKMQWDRGTMNIFMVNGDTIYIDGQTAEQLRNAVIGRCINIPSGNFSR